MFRFNFDAVLKTLNAKLDEGHTREQIRDMVKGLTWYVSTPFGREGSPDRVGDNMDVDIATGLDYKWVHFLVNDFDESVSEDVNGNGVYEYTEFRRYKKENQWYPGDQWKDKIEITEDVPNNSSAKGKELMNVAGLCNYLRQQIIKKLFNEPNDFDSEASDDEKMDDPKAGNNIYVTAFVDEFYYDRDPISGATSPVLWHSFTNRPMRMLHILCSAQVSKDGESSATGSVVTLRQRSIQTVYDTEFATEGWGGETVDEVKSLNDNSRKSVGFFYSDDAKVYESGYHTTTDQLKASDSEFNGLYNVGYLWNLRSGNSFNTSVKWNDYLDYQRENDYNGYNTDVITNFMKDERERATLRYSCMMRNRDNDGDGIIDKDEIKWYLASTEQLMTLFIGDLGLSGESQLYNIENPTSSNYKSHVVSSTMIAASDNTRYAPQIIWAEEGASVSRYDYDLSLVHNSVRCVRNLGGDYDLMVKNDYPGSPISVTKEGTGYRFDLTKLNKASKRIMVVEELVPQDEASEMSRVYNGFATGILGNNGNPIGINTDYPTSVYKYLNDGRTYCPEGYRMPNIREGVIMYFMIDGDLDNDGVMDNDGAAGQGDWREFYRNALGDDIGGFAVSSYYRYGKLGEGWDNQISWFFGPSVVSLGSGAGNQYVRCVRDVNP